ncbi:hypothetical protein D9623_00345 [Azospirillum brasilense]|uniref:Uncharacterized protein n=1 Tax=Azospirillum brasilense TaxID=192 RepID=A0A0P0EF93_AZOBR|nr:MULTISPECIES: hypothetical protein [Azospirillum]ALJ34265.1 hypothetical protein AMK58_01865 [Azospirillum brasilense]MDW7552746.1 hypothetical protein [Azospirillum brasilense]MDW7592062.1 hypothetical protein [Azospirillum brasilense]MDW7627661.1 hypothetical protein [Azospirillum brasilense]MDX5952870.1 hypothetical protein [Azospirillum brasilense]
MTLRHAEDLLDTLKRKRLSLDELHERARLSGLDWSRDQVELFLLCAPGVERDESGTFHVGASRPEEALETAIIDAVRSFAGKPIQAAQVRARLPADFVTTNEQILAIARRAAGLDVFGPNLIRIAP